MIDKKSRRVVIINNIRSESIDQAIFILKDSALKGSSVFSEKEIVTEAQGIIDRYMRQVERLKDPQASKRAQKKGGLPTLMTVSLTAAFMLAVFFVIVYTM